MFTCILKMSGSSALNKKKTYTQRHCFVPGCSTGYNSKYYCNDKISLFRAPSDIELRNKWNKAILRADKQLEENCCVCAKHFDEQFIERHYHYEITGKEVLLPKSRPTLKENAIPTIFPNLPKYLSTKPKIRPPPKLRDAIPAKKPKLSHEMCDDVLNCDLENFSVNEALNVKLPSKFWSSIQLKDSPSTVIFATWNTGYGSKDVLLCQPSKFLTIKENTDDSSVSCTVVVKGVNIKRYDSIKSISALENILKETEEIQVCEGAGQINEFFATRAEISGKILSYVNICDTIIRSLNCTGISVNTNNKCLSCKFIRKKLLNKRSQSKKKISYKKVLGVKKKLKCCSHKSIMHMKEKVKMLKSSIASMKRNESVLNEMKSLTSKQQLAINACLEASKRKSVKGMKYNKEWLLECIIMRLKSPRLYEHMRIHNILVLPSKTCIQKTLKAHKAGFGFNDRTFQVLKEKVKGLDTYSRYGNLIFDELKLSENLQVHSSGIVQGYVDFGSFSTGTAVSQTCDHGLVLLFQPFVGDWVQIIGVFATHANMKGSMLAKVILEAIINIENAGLFVAAVTGDGASWNRSMWKEFDIGVSKGNIQHKVIHPCDETRYLYFISDFPHLLKCLRNAFLKKGGFLTPDGEVRLEFLKAAWKADENSLTLRVIPKVMEVHFYPNSYEKMHVNLAFQLFSEEMLKALSFYAKEVSQYGDSSPTILFVKRILTLIKIMTSRKYHGGLRPFSIDAQFLSEFLKFLEEWEEYSGPKKEGFISKSTADGLKVTLSSTLCLLTDMAEIGYKYILTSRLSQDKLENLFSIVRNAKGCNDHPTPSEFLTIIECLSFYNLARAPKTGNVSANVISSLLSLPSNSEQDKESAVSKLIDEFIENGQITNATVVLNLYEAVNKKNIQRSESRLVYYIAGYVVRKFQTKTKCINCKLSLKNENALYPSCATFTIEFDKGGLSFPSSSLFLLISELEDKFTEYLSLNELHKDSILDIIRSLNIRNINFVGCDEHKIDLTKQVIKFFILTRLHFYVKQINRKRVSRREKIKHLKMRRIT